MKRGLGVLTLLAMLPTLGGYLGVLYPLGDSLAVFRAQGAVGLALVSGVALALRVVVAGRLGMVLAAVTGLPLAWGYLAPAMPGADLRLYQKNMLYRNPDLTGLEADIRATAPDVLTLQEVSEPNKALLPALSDQLPHQLWCPFEAVGGEAIATRLPPIPGREVCASGLAALQVKGPKGPLWLVSVHLYWPWPHEQAGQVADLLPVLKEMAQPVVMAGDFNMVGWSHALAALRGATGTVEAGPVLGTYTGFAPWVILPIDHVMAPGGGQTQSRPGLGSDHLWLLAELALTAGAARD